MSVALNYAASCAECGRMMRPGTLVEFEKKGDDYTYIHAGACQEPVVEEPKRRRPRFDLRECSNLDCYGAAGYAFLQGCAPARCHLCGSDWEWEMAA